MTVRSPRSRMWTLLILFVSIAAAGNVKIGVVVGPNVDSRLVSEELWSPFHPLVEQVNAWSTPHVGLAMCKCAKRGAEALAVLGLPPRLAPLISSYADHLQLPLMTDTSRNSGRLHLSLRPDGSKAAADYAKQLGWNDCAFIYDTDNGAEQLASVLSTEGFPLVGPFYRVHSASNALALLTRDTSRVLLATSEAMADLMLSTLPPGRQFHGILLTPVGIARRPTSVRNRGDAKLTKFSFLYNVALQQEIEHNWRTMERKTSDDPHIPEQAWFSYDASRVIESVLNSGMVNSHPPIDCFNETELREENFNRSAVKASGVSGSIQFEEDGRRKDYSLGIIEVTPSVLRQVGVWSSTRGVATPRVAFRRSEPPLRVTSFLVRPFLMRREGGGLEGFVVDFLRELGDETGRTYELQLVKDGRYGTLNQDGTWNGMVGEVVRGEADLAVADLTKTTFRAQAVAFGKTFLNVGLNILMKRPPHPDQESVFSPFAFVSAVWSPEMYVSLLLAIAIAGGVGYSLSRFLGAPDRVRALESKGTDNLSPSGSAWYAVAALLLRDAGIYPRSLSHRLWALLWKFVCLFLALCYVASLTAALVRARSTPPDTITVSRTTSHQLLQDFVRTGYPVIGTVRGGSSSQFFMYSEIKEYREVGTYLLKHPEASSVSVSDGVRRVRQSNGDYAFVMESAASEYESNLEPCDVIATSGFITTKSYALINRHNDTDLKEMLDEGVLNLLEKGTIRKLYDKWWHNVTDQCDDPNLDILPHLYSNSLSLHEVSGVFYLLMILVVVSGVTCGIEYFVVNRRKTAVIQ